MTGYATGGFAVQFVDALSGIHYDGTQSPYRLEFGNGSFRLDVTDNTSGGPTDTYGYTACNPRRVVLPSGQSRPDQPDRHQRYDQPSDLGQR
jgi:hypothetical protein